VKWKTLLVAVIGLGVPATLLVPGAAAQLPTEDSVVLISGPASAGSYIGIEINAASGPSGENPRGEVEANFGGLIPLGGPVTCLAVSGSAATINFADHVSGFGILTVQVFDGQPDTFDALPAGRAPSDCSPLPPTGLGGPVAGEIRVVDAQPFPTSKDECKNDGWRNFPGFKKHGDCVSFVASKGKNQPSGP
jgi:hypothetical protein